MIIKKCKQCGSDVEVQSRHATVVTCKKCLEKNGIVEEKRNYDTDDLIYCRICGAVKRVLFQHLLTEHKIQGDEYSKQFPDALFMSKNTSIKKHNRTLESKALTSMKSKATWQIEGYKDSFIVKKTGQKYKPQKLKTEEQKQLFIEHIIEGQNKSPEMQARRDVAKQSEQKRQDDKRKEKENLKEFVLCPLCLRENKGEIDSRFEFICFAHIISHNYSVDQFKNEFPVCKVKIDRLCDEHSDSLSGANHFNFGKHLSDEIRNRISEKNTVFLKTYYQNYNLEAQKIEDSFKKEDYELILNKNLQENIEDSYEFIYCRLCFKKFKSLDLRHLIKHGLTNMTYRLLFPDAPLRAKSTIDLCIVNSMNTKTNNNIYHSVNKRGHAGFRKDINHYTRSMIEANFCRMLILNNIQYTYEPKVFRLKHDVYSAYMPDILLLVDFNGWSTGTFIELKSIITQQETEKLNIFVEQYPDVKFDMVEFNSPKRVRLERLYKHKISLWETSSQNIKRTPELYV